MAPLPLPTPAPSDGAIVLRAWHDDDVPALTAAFADPVMRAARPDEAYTDDDAQQFLREQARERAEGTALELAVDLPSHPGSVLGGVSLYSVDLDDAVASLGYWTAPPVRGRGVAVRATRVLARWGFTALGLARISLTCGPDNVASQRVAERAGFVREGLMRAHLPFRGGRRDSLLYGLLPADLASAGGSAGPLSS